MIEGDDLGAKLVYYAREVHFHVVPWVLLAIPLLWWRPARHEGGPRGAPRQRRPQPQPERPLHADPLARSLLLFFPAFLLVTLPAPGTYLRYQLPLLPTAAVLVAIGVTALPLRWWGRWLVIVVLIGSNLVAWVTALPFDHGHRLRFALWNVIDEIGHQYVNRTEVVVNFLNRQAPSTQTAFSFDPEFPLMFYTRLRILDGRFTDGRLPDPAPEWIFAQSASGVLEQESVVLPPAVAPHYERVVLSTPRSRRLGSLPEPDIREHRTAPWGESFVLYRKRSP
jgi:hypothetical protein